MSNSTILCGLGNNFSTTLSANHTSGAASLEIASGAALTAALTAQGLPAISLLHPIRIVVSSVSTPSHFTIFRATNLSVNTLQVAVDEGTTDPGYVSGDTVTMEVTAGYINDLNQHVKASPINVKDFGAVGDGSTDDTLAIQAAIDVFSNNAGTGAVYFPTGTYKVTSSIRYLGSYSKSIRIIGEASSAGQTGALLQAHLGEIGTFDGPAVLEFAGGLDCVVQDLGIDAGGVAKYGVWIHADHSRGGPNAPIGCSHITLDRVIVGGVTNVSGAAAITLGFKADGTADNAQCDDISLIRCKLVGTGSPRTPYGLLTDAGNVKNFFVYSSLFNGFQTGVKFGGSGPMLLSGCVFGNNSITDVETRTGQLHMVGCESEGSTRCVVGSTGAHSGTVIIENSIWSGACPEDQFVIDYQASLRLIGNYFANYKLNPDYPTDPVMYLPAALRIRVEVQINDAATVVSEGNFYRGVTGLPPFFVSTGSNLFSQFKNVGALARSFADYGGFEGGLVYLAPQQTSTGVIAQRTLASTSSVTTIAANLNDGEMLADASASNLTITLPRIIPVSAGSPVPAGRTFRIKRIDNSSNTVTVEPDAPDTIEGASSYVLTTQYKRVEVGSDGTGVWYVWGSN